MKFDVVGFGALNVDRLYRVDEIAVGGDERFIKGYNEAPGGSAANTIVGLARLGNKVGFIGKIGRDREGKMLLESFLTENVDTRGIIISENDLTGKVIGFVNDAGERALYVDAGANETCCLEEIDKQYAADAKFLHLTSFVGEKPFHTQSKILRGLPDIMVSFDPGELYARKGIQKLKPILRRSFVVFPNEHEMWSLTGKGYEEGSKVLLKEGVKIVAVKLGERGCYITDGKERALIKAIKAKTVDTTGAGDAFCAGFLHGLLLGKDLYACGKIANFVASCKIEKIGSRAGLPRLCDLPKI